MADSCRPVSRHGRYNPAGPSNVSYGTDVPAYGNVDYTPSNEMYTVNQPERPERPRTSRGRRRKAEMPPRPKSRISRQHAREVGQDVDHESYGRPASRVGFSPESSYRYSHDEFSRQSSEPQVVNSPCSSPDVALYPAAQNPSPYSPIQQDNLGQHSPVDRLIISPSNPLETIYGKSPQNSGHSSLTYRVSPRQESQYVRPLSRPSPRDYINVSPIQRDEAQINTDDLHHDHNQPFPQDQDPYAHEGDAYVQGFGENPHYSASPHRDSPQHTQHRNSPYRDSPYRDSPQHRDSPYNLATSPTNKYSYGSSPQSYSRPPPSQRPKSARPKTGRKKSARARYRHEEQETSQPQMCNTESILHTGDPYGRPSSSLSRYKPLPAIGSTTPRTPSDRNPGFDTHPPNDSVDSGNDSVTHQTERLVIDDHTQFHPADDNDDSVCAEDIQGAQMQVSGPLSDQGLPNVNMLTEFQQHLSNEIYNQSVSNYEQNMSENDETVNRHHSAKISDKESKDMGRDMPQTSNTSEPLDFLHELPNEPSEGEDRMLLAVKLPDGKRIQRYFCPSDPLKSVVDFAENTSLTKFRDFHLVCNAPRTTFYNLALMIGDTGLQDRTVLYLEEKEIE